MARRSTKTRIKGASSADEQTIQAARASAKADDQRSSRKAQTADEAVRVVKEEHTRLAEPGESPDTHMGEFETKVEFGPDNETHTRLATPNDPEAKAIHKETMEMRKATGAGPVEKVQNAKDLPNAGDTPKEARAKQQAVFDKADEAGKAEIIADTQRRGAALGGGF